MSAPATNDIELRVPVAGESITEGVLGRWLAADGSQVQKGQPVFELETDKTNTEVPSPESGLIRHLVAEGTTVAVHAVVARITPGVGPVAAPSAPPAAAPAPPSGAAKKAAPPPTNGHAPTSSDVLTTPLARALMAEHGLTPAQVRGTGAHGRIRREDVLAAIARPVSQPATAPSPTSARGASGKPVRRERMTPVRRRFIDRLVKSMHTAAVLTTFNEVDMSAVLGLIARHGDAFAKRHGAPLAPEAFLIRAAAMALGEMPRANAMIEGDEIVSFDFCDISYSIDTPAGEAQPILRSAQNAGISGVAKWLHDARSRGAAGQLALGELAGATFGIVDDGKHGALLATPPLHAPQTATLGLHAIRQRVVCDDKRQPAVRPMMYVALAYDHRLLDGKDAVEFLVRIKELVESPERLLLDC